MGVMQHDNAHRWLRGLIKNHNADAKNSQAIERQVAALEKLLEEHGLPELHFEKLANEKYKVSDSLMQLKIGDGKLLVRKGAGYEPVLTTLGKLPRYVE